MGTQELKKEREAEAISGSKEVIETDKNLTIQKIEKNKEEAITHEQQPAPVKSQQKKDLGYDEGARGPSSD